MDLNNKILHVFYIGGVEVWLTQTIVNTWIIGAALIVFAVIVRLKLKSFKELPESRFQNVVEAIVETFEGFVKNSAGEKMEYIGGWFFTVFSFVLLSNLSGLLGFRPPTADWATTFALAFATFTLIQVGGFQHRKGEYARSFLVPHPVFLPLNLIGELARPISLSFRLFGNILAGMILMTLYYALTPIYLRFVVPAFLHAYFDVFAGVIQVYIFTVLSLTFIGVTAAGDEA